jgi:hypothetical protein
MGRNAWKMHDKTAEGAKNLRKGKLREGDPQGKPGRATDASER